jgi:hypothetical protein
LTRGFLVFVKRFFANKMDCRVKPANDDLMRILFHAAGEELLAGRGRREKREQRMGQLAFLRAPQHGRPIGEHDLHLVGYGAGIYAIASATPTRAIACIR